MSKRLQVILDDAEYRELQRLARRYRMTVSEWVRAALRAVRQQEPVVPPDRKISVVRAAARHDFPTADIDRMLAEIERGYRGDDAA
jgi:predicted transcriptional regulator